MQPCYGFALEHLDPSWSRVWGVGPGLNRVQLNQSETRRLNAPRPGMRAGCGLFYGRPSDALSAHRLCRAPCFLQVDVFRCFTRPGGGCRQRLRLRS